MNCKKCNELMSLYIDHQLDNSKINLFEEHLNNCEFCLKEYNELKLIINSLNNVEKELPENFHTELMEKINNIDYEQKNKFKNIFRFKYFSPVAALVCIIFIIYSNNINDISPELKTKVENEYSTNEMPEITSFRSAKISIPIEEQIVLTFMNKYNLDKEIILINFDNISIEDEEILKDYINKYNTYSNIKFEDELNEKNNLDKVYLKIDSIEFNDPVKIGIQVSLRNIINRAEIQLVNIDNGFKVLIIDKNVK